MRALLLRSGSGTCPWRLTNTTQHYLNTTTIRYKYSDTSTPKAKKETWTEYVTRLEPEHRAELERALRKHRRDHNLTVDLTPKNVNTRPPSWSRCRIVFIYNFVPFIFFGFLDNFLMILCGDAIDTFLGAQFCLGTMACAGIGNTISDAFGIGAAGYIEKFSANFLGMKIPDLNPHEQNTSRARRAKFGGQVMGIILGCLLGMCPLLFINRENDNENH